MTAEKMFSVMVLKFPGVAGLGLGEGKGGLGRASMPRSSDLHPI